MVGLFIGYLGFTLAISAFNAWSVGRVWVESKAVGGLPRFMAWMGATMSAIGFTWCYVLILASLASGFEWLDEQYVEAMISLGYLAIILPALGSGLAITVGSWVHFWREKNVVNGGVAGWNSFAQVYNTYSAIRLVPEALGNVLDAFKNIKGRSAAVLLMVVLVILAIFGGIITTSMIIRATASKRADELHLERMAYRYS